MADRSEVRPPAPAYVDPFQAFRMEMDKLAEAFLGRGMMPPRWDATPGDGGYVVPSIDLEEDETALVLTAELPGMDEKDVEVVVKSGLVMIRGQKRHRRDLTKDDVQVMERRYGRIERSIRLPDTVDAAKISASFDKGVLTVTMPKRPDAVASERRVSIAH